MRTAITIFLFIVSAPCTYGASFDCAKASSQVEKLICSNAELSKLDERLAVAYAQGNTKSKSKTEFKSSQQRWLVEKRNTCADTPCIKNTYEARLLEIEQGILATTISPTHDSVTGAWSSNIPGELLKTIQVGSNVRFELDLSSGAPAYNVGYIEGEFELHGKSGVFESAEYKKCKITFTFYPTKVILDSVSYIDCGFGHGVYAIGTFNLLSKEKPVFTGDPRM